jgi:hypothetical protein
VAAFGQPPQALVGKVVRIRVTETHKWHVTGNLIDVSPKIPHEDVGVYFPRKAKEWAAKNAASGLEEPAKPQAEVRIVEERIRVKAPGKDQFILHLLGMLLLSIGVYALLKGLNPRPHRLL